MAQGVGAADPEAMQGQVPSLVMGGAFMAKAPLMPTQGSG